jgi:hypothetical protein
MLHLITGKQRFRVGEEPLNITADTPVAGCKGYRIKIAVIAGAGAEGNMNIEGGA